MNAELDTRARQATATLRLSADAVNPVGRLHDLRRAERRRSRAQVAAAFAVLVALVAAGLLARRYDPPATGPQPSLATIPVGRQPTGMAVGGGALWVMNQGSGTVSRIDPGADRVVATVPVGASPDAIAVGRDAVWVGGRSRRDGNTVLRIDPRTNQVVASLRVAQPQAVALGFGSVWVASERAGEVLRIDPRTDPRTVAGAGRIKVDGQPTFLAVGPDAVWPGPASGRSSGSTRGRARSRPPTRSARPSTAWPCTGGRCGPSTRSATPSHGPGSPIGDGDERPRPPGRNLP